MFTAILRRSSPCWTIYRESPAVADELGDWSIKHATHLAACPVELQDAAHSETMTRAVDSRLRLHVHTKMDTIAD